jgi:hypothetical protein
MQRHLHFEKTYSTFATQLRTTFPTILSKANQKDPYRHICYSNLTFPDLFLNLNIYPKITPSNYSVGQKN